MSRRNRVLVIGLDGASLNVILPFAQNGIMPRMKEIVEQGAVGPLMSVTPPVTGPAWASFLTGRQPGKHGVFDFVKATPGSLIRKPVNYTDIKASNLISLISGEAGKTVCSFNVPITYPPPVVNGFVVTGMLTPDTDATFTYPESLKQQLETRFGPYVLDVFWQRFTDNTAEQFLNELIDYEKQKLGAAKELLSQREWDLFIAVFTGTDRIQHALWHVIEAILDGKTLSPKEERLKPLIRDYYALIDRSLADLVDAAGEETTVFFMSDHGFGSLNKKFLVNAWLRQKGWLSYDLEQIRKINRRQSFKKILKQNLMRFPVVYNLLRKKGPVSLEKRMNTYQFLNLIQWPHSTAYSVSNTEQGIYINLKGREPYGIVNPGIEYENLRDDIMDALRTLRAPTDGRQLVSHLYRKEELYQGPHKDNAPDIVFFLSDGEYLADVRLTEHLWEEVSWTTGRGTHRKEGLFIAYGHGVRKGTRVDANIVDLAPTVLFLLDIPISQDIDGTILDSVFEEEFLNQKAPQYAVAGNRAEEESEVFSLSEKEEEKVIQQLADLGYM
ncbi:MAG: alkaline phosphatase family protein [Thermodesulfobacteriota bacterium]|nr:alkaline phosphatase family protein [Thermodesulfobacteriota bacterium]